MRTLYSARCEQALSKLSWSPVLLLLHISGHLIPKHRSLLPVTSKVASPCSGYSSSTPSSSVSGELLSPLPEPPEYSLLPWGRPVLTSPWALSVEPWAASLPLSQLPTPSGWGWAGGRALVSAAQAARVV